MARVLALAGAGLPANLMPAGKDNPAGFWESVAISEFNDCLLSELDIGWDHPFGFLDARGQRPDPLRWLERARELIQNEFSEHRLFVLKDPRISLVPELWALALESEGIEARYIIMVRRPDEVARSLHLRNGITNEQGLLAWAANMVSAEQFTRERPRVFIQFEQLLAAPHSVLDAVEEGLAIRLPRRSRKTEVLIGEFLDAELQHHKYGGSLRIPAGFGEVEALYHYLEAASQDHPRNEDVPGVVADWLRSLEATAGPIIARAGYDLERLRSEGEAREAELKNALAVARTGEADAQARAGGLAAAKSEAEALAAELQASLEAASQAEALASASRVQAELLAEKLHSDLALLESEKARLGAEFDQLQSRLNKVAEAAALAEECVANASGIEAELIADQDRLCNEVERLRAEHDRAVSTSTELREEVSALQLALQETAAAARQASSERSAARVEMEELRERLRQADAYSMAARDEAARHQRELAAAQRALAEGENALVKAKQQVAIETEASRAAGRDAEDRVQRLEKQLREAREETYAARQEAREQSQRADNAEAALRTAQARLATVFNEADTLRSRLGEADRLVAEKCAELDIERRELRGARSEAREQRLRAETTEALNRSVQVRLAAVLEERDGLKCSAEAASAAATLAREDAIASDEAARAASAEAASWRHAAHGAESAAEAAQRRVDEIEREVGEKGAELDVTREERDQFKSELNTAEIELNALRDQLVASRSAGRQLMAAIRMDFAEPVRPTGRVVAVKAWMKRRLTRRGA